MKMDKKNCMSALWVVLAMMVPFVLSSCGDDGKESEIENPNATTSIRVTYSVELTDTWYEFYNVEMTYTQAGGTLTTKTLQMDETFEVNTPVAEAPGEVSLLVVAKPKTDHPEVVDGEKYILSQSISLKVEGLNKEGQMSGELYYTHPSSSSKTTSGDAFRKALEKEFTLYDYSYEIKK